MKRIKYSFVIILVFIIDQISKIVVANNINLNESRVVIKNFLNLTYVKIKVLLLECLKVILVLLL